MTPDVICVRRPAYAACSYLILRPDDTIVVDSGTKSDGSDITHALETLGRPLDSVSQVVLTHWHNDHAAGARALQDKTGATVLHHRAEAPFLRRESANGSFKGWLANVAPEAGVLILVKGLFGNAIPRPVESATFIADGDTVALGDTVADCLEVIDTPGHTEGHVALVYGRTLFAGDALAVVGNRLRYMARRVTLDHAEARRSMARLCERDINLICPGHRRPLTITSGDWAAFGRRVSSDEVWPLFG